MQKMAHRYHAFLLRIWQEDSSQNEWRVSLEEAGSDQRLGFGSIAELITYLQAMTQQPTPDNLVTDASTLSPLHTVDHTQINRSTQ